MKFTSIFAPIKAFTQTVLMILKKNQPTRESARISVRQWCGSGMNF